MKSRKKIGLALGSGAVRGLAHVGVLKTLIKHNIPIDYISGTSIGAWVGAHYALYEDIDKTMEFTVGKKKEKFRSFLEPSFGGGLIKGMKVKHMLAEWLEDAEFKNTRIPIRLVATDLVQGEPYIFKQGPLALAVQASMAIPGLFRPIKFQDKVLVDGGVCNPVPDNIVREMGADIVIAVNLDNFQEQSEPGIQKLGLNAIALRTAEVMRHYLAHYSMQSADIIIQPQLKKYSSWREYFLKDLGNTIVAIGETETEKIIPKLKKLISA